MTPRRSLIRFCGLILVFVVLLAPQNSSITWGQKLPSSSDTQRVRASLIDGGAFDASSGSHRLRGGVGHPFARETAIGSGHTLSTGFWQAAWQEVVTATPEIPAWTNHLNQCQPNPFNPRTTIAYGVAQTGRVEVTVYDVRGRRIRSLVGEVQSPGSREIVWDGRDDQGRSVATGIYLCRLNAEGFSAVQKMTLLK